MSSTSPDITARSWVNSSSFLYFSNPLALNLYLVDLAEDGWKQYLENWHWISVLRPAETLGLCWIVDRLDVKPFCGLDHFLAMA